MYTGFYTGIAHIAVTSIITVTSLQNCIGTVLDAKLMCECNHLTFSYIINRFHAGHTSSMLRKCIVLGQNCDASQTFPARATLWRYEGATATHKDGSNRIRCNGQSRGLANEWQERTGPKGRLKAVQSVQRKHSSFLFIHAIYFFFSNNDTQRDTQWYIIRSLLFLDDKMR